MYIPVKQGCVLSPALFNIFISDLPAIFDASCDSVGLTHTNISCLLYADDLVLMSETDVGLQNCLNKLESYCVKWNLTVNVKKTKIVIFNNGGHVYKRFKFFFEGKIVEIVQDYCYLGIVFNASGTFKHAEATLKDKASKSLGRITRYACTVDIDSASKLFSSLVLPVGMYGCEVWSAAYFAMLKRTNIYQLCDKVPLEQIQNKFVKAFLGVSKNATSAAIRGETGVEPILICAVNLLLKFAFRVSKMPLDSLVYHSYLECKKLMDSNAACWLTGIKELLDYTGNNNVYTTLITGIKIVNPASVCKKITKVLMNRYAAQWKDVINNKFTASVRTVQLGNTVDSSSKLRTYCTFKDRYCRENYLSMMKSRDSRSAFTRLRISAHNLAIETGRHTKPKVKLEDRLCTSCNELEDEFHFVMTCTRYADHREMLFQQVQTVCPTFDTLTDHDKFNFLMTCNNGDFEMTKDVCTFVRKSTEMRKSM